MNIKTLIDEAEINLAQKFKEIDDLVFLNSKNVLDSFSKEMVSETDLNGTTGYGYNDVGRDKIERVFANVLGAEDALVRSQFISGTHALTIMLFGVLRPGDTILSITGKPYDTLDEVIGVRDNPSSLKSLGINYAEINLIDSEFDNEGIINYLKSNSVKAVYIQRSRGYDLRNSLSIPKCGDIISKIKNLNEKIIVLVDNCYTEFVEDKTPLMVGADLIAGSLIKNLGGGIAPNGGYIAGKASLVNLCAERLNVPGLGKEVGPSGNMNRLLLQGLYMAPSVVGSSLKINLLASYIMYNLGYEVNPTWNEKRSDIVLSINFKDKEKMIKFCQGIQSSSAIDSNALPIPSSMPGYDSLIIMASGSFIQGSSIEISADGRVKPPYTLYLQGGITYQYGKIALIKALENIL